MIRAMTLTIAERLEFYHQEHLLQGWQSLPQDQQAKFAQELEQIDFDQLIDLYEGQAIGKAAARETPAQLALRAKPPSSPVRQPRTALEAERWNHAAKRGAEILRQGRVGAILVAGGQGTRLGFPHPKGMYPIGPVSNASLFQLLCEQLLARTRQAGKSIPYYVMTSEATHSDTIEFFSRNRYFGLPADDVMFFQQGTMPAVDATTGKLILTSPGHLAMSPDGHGGMLKSLQQAKLLDDMQRRGVDFLFYHQVDNPQAIVADPAFLGWHEQEGAEVSIKVVAKTAAEEKVGLAVEVDGKTRIIEYSDMPPDVARRRTDSGDLEFWAGSTAVHIFNRDFLVRLLSGSSELPFHIAHKAVPYFDAASGKTVSPSHPNAYKFEKFIFDVLPEARKALVLEGDRSREYAPLKNASGANSPSEVKNSLANVHRRWLTEAGYPISNEVPVEISPLIALDATELAAKLKSGVLPVTTPQGLLFGEVPVVSQG